MRDVCSFSSNIMRDVCSFSTQALIAVLALLVSRTCFIISKLAMSAAMPASELSRVIKVSPALLMIPVNVTCKIYTKSRGQGIF